jgi:hypothetical protein
VDLGCGCYRNGRDFWGTRPGKKGRLARVEPVHWPPRVQATPENNSVAASPLMKRMLLYNVRCMLIFCSLSIYGN